MKPKEKRLCPRCQKQPLLKNYDELWCINCGTVNYPRRASDQFDDPKFKPLKFKEFKDLQDGNKTTEL